jgi:hypothetical protein
MTVIAGPRTLAEYIEWVSDHKERHQGGPWATRNASFCEQLVNNAGGFGSDAYASAAAAAAASGTLNKNMSSAKPGEFVYWTNHVGVVSKVVKGVPYFVSASTTYFLGNPYGGHGEMRVVDYRAAGQAFLGHSYRHGNHKLRVPKPVVKPPVVKPPVVVPPPVVEPPVVVPPVIAKPTVKPGSRTVRLRVAGVYKGPSRRFKRTGLLRPRATHTVHSWTHGQRIDGNDRWFQLGTGWVWSGNFTTTSITNIPAHGSLR